MPTNRGKCIFCNRGVLGGTNCYACFSLTEKHISGLQKERGMRTTFWMCDRCKVTDWLFVQAGFYLCVDCVSEEGHV